MVTRCLDMFSRYLVTVPIANKDTLTVTSALTQLFIKYGSCKTVISDLGSEFTSLETHERDMTLAPYSTGVYASICTSLSWYV